MAKSIVVTKKMMTSLENKAQETQMTIKPRIKMMTALIIQAYGAVPKNKKVIYKNRIRNRVRRIRKGKMTHGRSL